MLSLFCDVRSGLPRPVLPHTSIQQSTAAPVTRRRLFEAHGWPPPLEASDMTHVSCCLHNHTASDWFPLVPTQRADRAAKTWRVSSWTDTSPRPPSHVRGLETGGNRTSARIFTDRWQCILLLMTVTSPPRLTLYSQVEHPTVMLSSLLSLRPPQSNAHLMKAAGWENFFSVFYITIRMGCFIDPRVQH